MLNNVDLYLNGQLDKDAAMHSLKMMLRATTEDWM